MERAEGGKRKTKVCRRTEGTAFKCNLLQSRPKRRVSFVRPRNAHVCPSRSEHACSCTRIDSSSSSSSFSGRMRGNRNGIYVRDNDTRRRIDRSNSKIRSVSIGSRIELLSIDASLQCLPSTTHRFQLSLFLPLSRPILCFSDAATRGERRSKRAHAHDDVSALFRSLPFPTSSPLPLDFTPVSNRTTRMRIDSTETIAFRIHSKKGWSAMGIIAGVPFIC